MIFAFIRYTLEMGEMKGTNAREEEARMRDRASTVTIAAAIIAAVRLARDENISLRVTSRVGN